MPGSGFGVKENVHQGPGASRSKELPIGGDSAATARAFHSAVVWQPPHWTMRE